MQKNKISISELLGERLDPYYYKKEFVKLKNKLMQLKYTVNVGSIIKSWSRGDGPREGFYTEDSINGIYFLRVNNLVNGTIKEKNSKYIKREIHETKLKRSQVTYGDIVFAISGTKDNLATVSIIPKTIKEANLNSALVKINVDKDKVLPKYFVLYFTTKIARKQIEHIGKGAAQNNLNNEEISQIKIPVPPMSIQQKIVDIMDKAYSQKEQKEKEAERLLASIDDYILDELGITIPKICKEKDFKCNISGLLGGRLDVEYNQPYYKNMHNALKDGIYKVDSLKVTFKDKNLIKGKLPKVIKDTDELVNTIQITNIKKEGHIDFSKINKGSKKLFNEKQIINNNDILVVATGATIGKVGLFKKQQQDYYLASDILKFTVNSQNNPQYIQALLLSKTGQVQILKNITGATNGHLSPYDLEGIQIPIPPIPIQNKIANNVQNIMQKAEKLKKEAIDEINIAKAKVEKIILRE